MIPLLWHAIIKSTYKLYTVLCCVMYFLPYSSSIVSPLRFFNEISTWNIFWFQLRHAPLCFYRAYEDESGYHTTRICLDTESTILIYYKNLGYTQSNAYIPQHLDIDAVKVQSIRHYDSAVHKWLFIYCPPNNLSVWYSHLLFLCLVESCTPYRISGGRVQDTEKISSSWKSSGGNTW